VMAANGNYYVYATMGNGVNIQVASSPDLVAWTWHGEALPTPPPWGGEAFWAPDVQEHNGTFYMYYASEITSGAGKCIGVATSTNPLGPFKDVGQPVVCGPDDQNIDAKSFDDPQTGKIFLYWRSDEVPLAVQELNSDRVSLAPNSQLIETIYPNASMPYMPNIEASWMWLKPNLGYYYLFFSGDECCSPQHYSVEIARSLTATGPFQTISQAFPGRGNNTIMVANAAWSAPGHNSIVTDNAGQDWMFYHAYFQGQTNARVLMMDPVNWVNGWPVMGNSAPSTGPYTAPSV